MAVPGRFTLSSCAGYPRIHHVCEIYAKKMDPRVKPAGDGGGWTSANLEGLRMEFASDNAAGVAPAILDALVRANAGCAIAYGHDALTRRLERRFSEVFERDVAVFLVGTGTAANALRSEERRVGKEGRSRWSPDH